jgi:hypothetical protein
MSPLVRLTKKWLLISVGGGFLLTATLFALPDSFVLIAGTKPHPVFDAVMQALFWPVALCVYLSGPGPDIGQPGRHMHEATPVQIFAALIGIGLSWTFYSSLIFFVLWLRRKRRLLPRTASNS